MQLDSRSGGLGVLCIGYIDSEYTLEGAMRNIHRTDWLLPTGPSREKFWRGMCRNVGTDLTVDNYSHYY